MFALVEDWYVQGHQVVHAPTIHGHPIDAASSAKYEIGDIVEVDVDGAREIPVRILRVVAKRDVHAEKGWLVFSVKSTGEAYYKFHVHGFNHYNGEEFSWRVPDVDGRYDLSLVGGAT